MKSNIFDCRFVDNKNEKVIHVREYGETESQIRDFWIRHFPNGRNDPYSFLDAELVKKDTETEKDKADAVELFKAKTEGKREWTKWFHELFSCIYKD